MLEYFAMTRLSDSPDTRFEKTHLMVGVISLFISIYTAKLALSCNKKADVVVQAMATLFAFFFSATYLLYYIIRYALLGDKC